MMIPTVKSRTSQVSYNKGNEIRRLWFKRSNEFVERVGVIMDIQVPLMIIDRRGVSIMSALFTNRRVTHLKFVEAFEWIRNIREKTGQHRDYFNKHRNCFWDIGIVQESKC